MASEVSYTTVDNDSSYWREEFKQILDSLPGVRYHIDEDERKTLVWGKHDPVKVVRKLKKVDKSVHIYELESKNPSD